MPEEISILSALFVQTGDGLDNIISILRRGGGSVEVVDLISLAQAAGLTPSDSLKMDDIRIALGLLTTNTVQDAINAASN